MNIKKIEGIGRVYADKLARVGVKTTERLLKDGTSRRGRQDLAGKAGISETLILEWVNLADLMRIKGTDGRARLLNEAQATAKLKHPNIVTVHDAGEIEESPYIVMELVEGETLHDKSPDGLADIIAIIKQICTALEHAHTNGIIHRDLKPENVILEEDGTAKLMDFGLARSVASRLTKEGTLVGTVFYMAPEQAMGKQLDGRADLYALGVMLYELTARRLPFTDDDPVAIISQHIYASVVPPTTYDSAIPPELEALTLRLLAKDPEDRYSSASDVLEAIEEFEANLSGNIDAVAIPSSSSDRIAGGITLLDRMVRGRLIGREDELAELRNVWDRAENGQGHMVLISGEPGIGKTRLAKELVVYAQLHGAVILEGRFHPELGIPYLGFWEALRDYLRSQPPDSAREEIGTTAPELIKLVPEIGTIVGEVEPNPPMGDVETERLRLFDHVSQFLLRVTSNRPILFLLEDLHWADKPSLLLLHFILRNITNAPVLMVGTYRETDLDPERPFYETLVGLNRERLYTRLILRRLSSDRINELVRSLLDCSVAKVLEQAIAQETDGNPFFVEEVVRSLLEKETLTIEGGCYVPVEGTEIQVPQSIQVALGKRLSGLSEDCHTSLTQAAVLGGEFDFDVLLTMGSWDEDTLLDVLDEAVRAQIISESKGTAETKYYFLHALLVQVLYDSINRRRQARYHQQAAEAMETVYAGKLHDYVEALAHHFSRARSEVADKALQYNLQAAEKAVAVYAHEQAVQYFSMALEVSQDINDLQQEAVILELLGDTHYTTFEIEEAIKAYESAQSVLEKAGQGEGDQYHKLFCKLGQLIAKEGIDPEKARGYLQRALAHMPADFEGVERVKCNAALATCLVQEEEVPKAFKQAEITLKLAEDSGQANGVATACGALCKVHEAQGDVAAFMEIATRQIDALDESGDLYHQFEAYRDIIVANYYTGNYDIVERYALQAFELSKKFQAPGWESIILAGYSWILRDQGRWSEALANGERILPLFDRVGCTPCFSFIYAVLAEIEARRGNDDITREYIDSAVNILQQIETPGTTMGQLRWRIFGHFFLEEWEQAWELVEETRTNEYPMFGTTGSWFHMTIIVPEVAARLGLLEEVESLTGEAFALSQNPHLPLVDASAHFALGLAHAGRESWDAAINEFEDALSKYQGLSHPWDVARTQYELGTVYSSRGNSGDLEVAQKCWQEALATFESLEAAPAVEKVNLALLQFA